MFSFLTRDFGTAIPCRHCGLDPQSPKRKGYVSALGRWRMFLRHDGDRYMDCTSHSLVRLCKNIQKKRLSRGRGGTAGLCPYFFEMSTLVFIENQQYSN